MDLYEDDIAADFDSRDSYGKFQEVGTRPSVDSQASTAASSSSEVILEVAPLHPRQFVEQK